MVFGQEKVAFLNLPTPLEYLPNISRECGVKFFIKRDDLLSLGVGGNKLRKLEYLLYDAQKKGATRLVTMGGAQTNHGRLTAAVAAKYGLKCTILCIDEYPGELSANLLLDRLMGADVVLEKSDGGDQNEQYKRLARRYREKYEAAGEVVYEIPIGGSNTIGLLGYYECAQELERQVQSMGLTDARVICAVGSMGTYAGLYCGLKDIGSSLHLTGVAISPFTEAKGQRLRKYVADTAAQYGLNLGQQDDFDLVTQYTRGGYNNPCKEVRDAICFMAQKEAIILDPCYTGKAFAGILEMIESGEIQKGETVIFLHTGGTPGIYTGHHRVEFEKELQGGVEVL